MHDLARRLPDIATVRDRCRAMAVLDAVLSPEWESRYHSFDAHWDEGEETASARDGSGSDWFMVFSAAGAYARGFDHTVPNAPEILAEVPEAFRFAVEEPAFRSHDGSPIATVCLWRQPDDAAWRAAAAPAGGEELFELLAEGTPEAYRAWAEEYFETEVDLAAVRHVFAHRPLTQAVVDALNSEVDLEDLREDLAEIGYPG
ncbi:hypothetical protein BX265_8583 [Streptomyces sp. TLI_235]|nr:hypothetical protein [Streptomyces sp. TLI_235]PBC66095.1 hypothetical protein BX265_8583 [Streptomyces sp. TLI_235]